MNATTSNRPRLSLLFAMVLSTFGFLTSVLVMTFFWLIPAWKPSTPSTHPRPPPPLATPKPLAKILRRSSLFHSSSTSQIAPASPRRVSFDLVSQGALSTSSVRRKHPGGPVPQPEPEPQEKSVPLAPSSSSIRSCSNSSTSTLVNPSPPHNEFTHLLDPCPRLIESGDDSNLDSDASHPSSTSSIHRKSLFLSNRLPSVKKALSNHKRRTSAPAASVCECIDRSNTDLALSKSSRRSPSPFHVPWSPSRRENSPSSVETPLDPDLTPTSTSVCFTRHLSLPRPRTPPTPTSPSFFLRKPERRCSAPVPRTQPYGAPYYAPMPVQVYEPMDGSYTSHLKSLPQFGDELPVLKSPVDDNADGRSEVMASKWRSRPQVPQIGRPPRKDRSTSRTQ